MVKAFKYRLWTNSNDSRELGIMLETHRHLYNQCLEQRKSAYEEESVSLKYSDQSKWFTQERKTNKYFQRINYSSGQRTMKRLDESYTSLFRRIKKGEKPGFPRFKSKYNFKSFEFTIGDGAQIKGNKLYIQHVGYIRIKLHRPIEGKIKTIRILFDGYHWHVIFACELEDQKVVKSHLPTVGIDMGLERFLTTSNNTYVKNPRFLKDKLPELRRAQRSQSRKKKGGNNRRKAAKKTRKIHNHVKNYRREFHFRIANLLIARYGFIAMEKLEIKSMLKNHRYARSISDAGWASFFSILKHKAESAGVEIIQIDPKYTSQECSHCHEIVKKDLWERKHKCPFCGLRIHRDQNAARVILHRGLLARTLPTGLNFENTRSVQRSH